MVIIIIVVVFIVVVMKLSPRHEKVYLPCFCLNSVHVTSYGSKRSLTDPTYVGISISNCSTAFGIATATTHRHAVSTTTFIFISPSILSQSPGWRETTGRYITLTIRSKSNVTDERPRFLPYYYHITVFFLLLSLFFLSLLSVLSLFFLSLHNHLLRWISVWTMQKIWDEFVTKIVPYTRFDP